MEYYNEIAQGYNELHKAEQLNKIRIICSEYDFSNKKILDIGCGPGYILGYLIENNVKFKEYTGIDPSVELMKLNKNYNNKNSNNIKFIKSRIEEYKLNKVDVIIIISSIHHFDDINIIKELKKYAKSFIFSVYKRSRKFNEIKRIIKQNFKVKKIISERKDMIYFLE